MRHHACGNFRQFGMECPFGEIEEHQDEEEDERFKLPFAVPARRANDRMAENLSQFPVVAHGQPDMAEKLKRIAAIQREGGLQSIPNFPFGGRGHPELISILAAIAIMTGLRALQASGFGTGSQGVRASEMRAGRGLSGLSGTSGVAQGSRTGLRGRGGLHVQAETFRRPFRAPKVGDERDEALRRLLGFRGPRGGFDEFSETGF